MCGYSCRDQLNHFIFTDGILKSRTWVFALLCQMDLSKYAGCITCDSSCKNYIWCCSIVLTNCYSLYIKTFVLDRPFSELTVLLKSLVHFCCCKNIFKMGLRILLNMKLSYQWSWKVIRSHASFRYRITACSLCFLKSCTSLYILRNIAHK